MRLTKGMLRAILTSTSELLAGEGPQGYREDSREAEEIMRNAERVQIWCHEQLDKRTKPAPPPDVCDDSAYFRACEIERQRAGNPQ